MKDTSRMWYEIMAVNETSGERKSLGIGRDFQARLYSNGLSAAQRDEGWKIEIEERKDLGPVPGTTPLPKGRMSRRRSGRGHRMSKRMNKR